MRNRCSRILAHGLSLKGHRPPTRRDLHDAHRTRRRPGRRRAPNHPCSTAAWYDPCGVYTSRTATCLSLRPGWRPTLPTSSSHRVSSRKADKYYIHHFHTISSTYTTIMTRCIDFSLPIFDTLVPSTGFPPSSPKTTSPLTSPISLSPYFFIYLTSPNDDVFHMGGRVVGERDRRDL